jgi:4-hydroxy-3-methylbut-2-enyl diphosphate reductase
MSKIRIARNSGCCFGVKRAIKLSEEAGSKYAKVHTLGPIIHNPQMVEFLSSKGVEEIDNLAQVTNNPVVIRSHGIPFDELQELKNKQVEIIDATCPYVAKAHDYAKIADKEKYTIVILGNEVHPEIVALKSYINGELYIVNDDYSSIPKRKLNKIAVICQTTQNSKNLENLVTYLLDKTSELRIFNTICNATNVRQDASIELSKKSDIMIVIGGKNSSNTKMLATLCSENTKTYHIETANELNDNWFSKEDNIGLTAGASTPDWIIIDVYNKINKIVGMSETAILSIEDIPGYKEEINEC